MAKNAHFKRRATLNWAAAINFNLTSLLFFSLITRSGKKPWVLLSAFHLPLACNLEYESGCRKKRGNMNGTAPGKSQLHSRRIINTGRPSINLLSKPLEPRLGFSPVWHELDRLRFEVAAKADTEKHSDPHTLMPSVDNRE